MAHRRRQRFDAALNAEPVDRSSLAELAWSGVPADLSRCEVWQLLLGYRPLAQGRCKDALQRKRQEYRELRKNFYGASPAVAAAAAAAQAGEDETAASQLAAAAAGMGGSDAEAALLKQLRKDLRRPGPRGASAKSLAEHPRVQAMMERVLFVWAVRQPASGYVQGLNDVLLVLIVVSLADGKFASRTAIGTHSLGIELLEHLSEDELDDMEADCYWCTVKILSEIFDHYTQDFPGIQRMSQQLREILRRIDTPLIAHLDAQGIDIFQTAFQWMACLMVRDLPIPCCIRLWDTLIAESALPARGGGLNNDKRSAGFEVFLVYFCACFTAYFSARLQAMDLEATLRFLQRVPTDEFSEADLEVLLSEAFVLKSLFQNAPQHLTSK
jgi:hypothetical protein